MYFSWEDISLFPSNFLKIYLFLFFSTVLYSLSCIQGHTSNWKSRNWPSRWFRDLFLKQMMWQWSKKGECTFLGIWTMALKLQKTEMHPSAWGLAGLLTTQDTPVLQVTSPRAKETTQHRRCSARGVSWWEQIRWEEDGESSHGLISAVGTLADRFSWCVWVHRCLISEICLLCLRMQLRSFAIFKAGN